MQGMPISPVAEIEARQDEVIRLLDELNLRIEWALFELGVTGHQPTCAISVPSTGTAEAA